MTTFLLKNLVSLAGAELVSKAVTFLAFAFLAREFGASGFGYIEWAGAALMCASLIVDQGFSAYGTREIAKDPDRVSELVSQIVTARYLLAFLGYAAIAALAFIFVSDPSLRGLLLVYGLSLWFLPLLLQWVFQGFDRMHLVALAQVLRQSVFAAFVFLFVRSYAGIYLVGLAETVAVLSAAVFCIWAYTGKFSDGSQWRPSFSRRLFREGFPIGLSQMFWVLKMFGATFIVGIVATAEDTGYFAGAMRIYIALHAFVWLYYANLLPSFARGWDRQDGSFSRLLKGSMLVIVPLNVVGVIVWVTVSPIVMSTVYGADFVTGGAALQWLGGAFAAAAISGHFRFGLIAAGFQDSEMWTAALGAAFAVVALPFGYWNGGVAGAAAALFAAEVLVLAASGIAARLKIWGAAVPEGQAA